MTTLNLIDLINTNNYTAILENEDLFDYQQCDEIGNTPFLLACEIQKLDIIIIIFKHIDIYDYNNLKPNYLSIGYLTILSKNINTDTYKIYKLLNDKMILHYRNLSCQTLERILYSLFQYSDNDIYKIFDIILPHLFSVPFFKYGTILHSLLLITYASNLPLTLCVFFKYFKYDEFLLQESYNTDMYYIINSSSNKIFNIILNYIYNNNLFKIRDKRKLLKYICKYSTSTNILNELLYYFDTSNQSDNDFLNFILKNKKLNIPFREIISNHSIDYLLK